MPPCNAMPFIAAAMPCSRTPSECSGRRSRRPTPPSFPSTLGVVRGRQVARSAEPSSGNAGTSTSSTLPEACRVASLGFSAKRSRPNRANQALQVGRGIAGHRRFEVPPGTMASAPARALLPASSVTLPRAPAASRRRGSPPARRTARAAQRAWHGTASISSAPRGEPWIAAVPALLGAPKPDRRAAGDQGSAAVARGARFDRSGRPPPVVAATASVVQP